MTKPKSALGLLALVGDAKFTEAMVLLPVWEQVRPKPWKHEWHKDSPVKDVWNCHKCKAEEFVGGWRRGIDGAEDNHVIIDYLKGLPCLIPDTFTGSLAELAFELRDKVLQLPQGQKLFAEAADKTFLSNFNCESTWYLFWLFTAKPEHWIIAALCTLELVEKGKEK
jgi:hypothetical protein